jgi:hypothetical protein
MFGEQTFGSSESARAASLLHQGRYASLMHDGKPPVALPARYANTRSERKEKLAPCTPPG